MANTFVTAEFRAKKCSFIRDFPHFQIVRTVFFSETDFLIIRTPGSIFIFYLFELKGNLPYLEEG